MKIQNQSCVVKGGNRIVPDLNVTGTVRLKNDEYSLQEAVANVGPISIGIFIKIYNLILF